MTYQLQRLYDFAASCIMPQKDLETFIDRVLGSTTGSIICSEDRIRFASVNVIFRFRTRDDVRRVCDLMDDYYSMQPSRPTLQCDELEH